MHSVAMAMVVETCAYEVSWPFSLLSGYCVGNCLRQFIVAMAMVVMGDMCVQSIMAIRTIIRLVKVIKCLRLFVVVIYGDGSDGRHVCTQYHGHTHYYQATMLEIVINCLRLFVVVTMAMVVMGGMCVQSIMAILCWK